MAGCGSLSVCWGVCVCVCVCVISGDGCVCVSRGSISALHLSIYMFTNSKLVCGCVLCVGVCDCCVCVFCVFMHDHFSFQGSCPIASRNSKV